jgi:phosphatidylglycerophosphate synthase
VTSHPATGYLHRLREFRRSFTGVEGLFWIKRVNHPIGAVIAMGLLGTGATPNMISVAGLVVHLVAAGVLFLSPVPASLAVALFMVVAWQLAFSLDCADGQLARARRKGSAFGAFFDQVIDVATHALVYTATTTYLVRALGLGALDAALLVAAVFSLNFLQLYTTWGRNAIMGTEPAVQGTPPSWLGMTMRAKDLLDYGFYLFVAAVLLPWPVALLWFLIGYSVVSLMATLAQVGLNWYRFIHDSRRAEHASSPGADAQPGRGLAPDPRSVAGSGGASSDRT